MLVYLAALDSPEDRDVFQRLYTRYRGLMFRGGPQILHNDQDAEDVQSTTPFLALVDHVKISDPDSPKTRAFVVTIVEHKAIDSTARRPAAPPRSSGEAQGIAVPSDGDDGLARCILVAVAAVPGLILLRYDQGYSTMSSARLLGLSMDAASAGPPGRKGEPVPRGGVAMISEEALARGPGGRPRRNRRLPAPAECRHTFSPAFEEKMDRLLRRRRRRQRWYRGCGRQPASGGGGPAGAIFLGTVPRPSNHPGLDLAGSGRTG